MIKMGVLGFWETLLLLGLVGFVKCDDVTELPCSNGNPGFCVADGKCQLASPDSPVETSCPAEQECCPSHSDDYKPFESSESSKPSGSSSATESSTPTGPSSATESSTPIGRSSATESSTPTGPSSATGLSKPTEFSKLDIFKNSSPDSSPNCWHGGGFCSTSSNCTLPMIVNSAGWGCASGKVCCIKDPLSEPSCLDGSGGVCVPNGQCQLQVTPSPDSPPTDVCPAGLECCWSHSEDYKRPTEPPKFTVPSKPRCFDLGGSCYWSCRRRNIIPNTTGCGRGSVCCMY